MSFKSTIDLGKLVPNVQKASDKAQYAFASQVMQDIRPYVPFLEGTLSNTSLLSFDGKEIIYPMTYAGRLYKGNGFNFTKTFHPLAGPEWDIRAKAVHMSSWEQMAKKEVGDNL